MLTLQMNQMDNLTLYHAIETNQSCLTTIIHMTLMMTSAQVVKISDTITNSSPSQDYTHLDNQTTLSH